MSGVDAPVIDFRFSRLNTLFTVPPPALGLPPLPRAISFCHVKAADISRPCEYRLVSFTCSESYQLLPRGAQRRARLSLYSGKGRRVCATVALPGYPA